MALPPSLSEVLESLLCVTRPGLHGAEAPTEDFRCAGPTLTELSQPLFLTHSPLSHSVVFGNEPVWKGFVITKVINIEVLDS